MLLPMDVEIPASKTFTVKTGATLTVPQDKTLTNSGTMTVNGKLTVNGILSVDGEVTISENGTLDGNGTFMAALKNLDVTIANAVYTGAAINLTPTIATTRLIGRKEFTVDASGYILKYQKKNAGDTWDDVAVIKDAGIYQIVYTKANSPNVVKEFTVTQSGTSFDGGIKTYKGNTEQTTFTYGEIITVKVTPKASGTAARSLTPPSAIQMALYIGSEQITDPQDVVSGTELTFSYDTSTLPIDQINKPLTITAKYLGDNNMAKPRAA